MMRFQTNSGRPQRSSSLVANSRLFDGVGGRPLRLVGAIVGIDLRTKMHTSGISTLKSQQRVKS